MYSDKRSGQHTIKTKAFGFMHNGKSYKADTAPDEILIAALVFKVSTVEKVDAKLFKQGAPTFTENGVEVSITYPNKQLKPDADLITMRQEELGAYRWSYETAGITLSGLPIPTDRSDRTLIKQALDEIGDPPEVMPFKAGVGTWVSIDKPTLQAAWSSISDFVKACYAAEKTHSDAMELLAGEAILNYDYTTGWPSNQY